MSGRRWSSRAGGCGIAVVAIISFFLLSGTAVAQGVTGYQEVPNTMTLSVPMTSTVTSSCPTGTEVVGGGFQVQSPALMHVIVSEPASGGTSTTTWQVTIQNTSKTAVQVTVTAVCIAGPVTGYFEATNSASAAPQTGLASVTATCPVGDVVVGGGFSDPAGVPELTSLPETSSNIVNDAWTSEIDTSNLSSTVTISAAAICVAGTLSGYAEPTTNVNANGGTTTSVPEPCPSGAIVLGGGFGVGFSTVAADQPASGGVLSNSTWSADVLTPAGVQQVVTVTAICADLAPIVTGVSPSSGPAAGGTSVTITGSNLSGATGVSFGSASASSVHVVSATQVTATAPTGTGTVDVTVTTAGGTSATSTADHFTYIPAPTITSVSPTGGPTSGTTLVTINGTNLSGATAVNFGSVASGSFTVVNSGQITATAPAQGPGTINVTVTTPGGTSATGTTDKYTYVAAPAVTSVSPPSGPTTGATSVTITGVNLTGASAVKFGGTAAASFTINSATSITATSPAGSGTVDVTVTTVGGTSATGTSDKYTYVLMPTVTGVSPSSGPTAGGTSVTITGTNLTAASAVKFGATAAAAFTVNSATRITATSPAGSGTVDVTVRTAGGLSPTSSKDQFSYNGPPTVTGISPASGPTAGGTSVTITGGVLAAATAVHFGTTAVPAGSFTVNSATQITATAPAGAAGTVDVTVTTPFGTSTIGSGDKFTYVSPPTVTGVSPATGPTTGATSITITGANLGGVTAVAFGSTPAASVTAVSGTQITAASPPGAAGTVDVTVTTPGGTSATGPADQFTYTTPGGPSRGGPSGVSVVVPTVVAVPPSVSGGTGATFSATVNPNGSPTTVYFEYGLDAKYGLASGAAVYSQTTSMQTIGAGSTGVAVTATVGGLVPNALYDVRAVATNAAGSVTGADTPFMTARTAPPPPPVIGQTANFTPVSGTVYVRFPGSSTGHAAGLNSAQVMPQAIAAITKGAGFIPLTEARQLPVGTQVDARAGTLKLVTATTAKTKHKRAETQSGDFSGALFLVAQSSRRREKGLTTLSLLSSGLFPGAPSYSTECVAVGKQGHVVATIAKAKPLSKKVLQALSENEHGNFVTKGKYSAATVRGTQFSVSDRCDGTLTVVKRGLVVVTDNRTRKTITLHAHQSYLAKAR